LGSKARFLPGYQTDIPVRFCQRNHVTAGNHGKFLTCLQTGFLANNYPFTPIIFYYFDDYIVILYRLDMIHRDIQLAGKPVATSVHLNTSAIARSRLFFTNLSKNTPCF